MRTGKQILLIFLILSFVACQNYIDIIGGNISSSVLGFNMILKKDNAGLVYLNMQDNSGTISGIVYFMLTKATSEIISSGGAWCAIGFGNTNMSGLDVLFFKANADGSSSMEDRYANGYAEPGLDTAYGGTNNIVPGTFNTQSISTGGFLTLFTFTFSRSSTALDKLDWAQFAGWKTNGGAIIGAWGWITTGGSVNKPISTPSSHTISQYVGLTPYSGSSPSSAASNTGSGTSETAITPSTGTGTTETTGSSGSGTTCTTGSSGSGTASGSGTTGTASSTGSTGTTNTTSNTSNSGSTDSSKTLTPSTNNSCSPTTSSNNSWSAGNTTSSNTSNLAPTTKSITPSSNAIITAMIQTLSSTTTCPDNKTFVNGTCNSMIIRNSGILLFLGLLYNF